MNIVDVVKIKFGKKIIKLLTIIIQEQENLDIMCQIRDTNLIYLINKVTINAECTNEMNI